MHGMELHAWPLKSIHPFPARMAPELALAHAETLPAGSVVLDPMAGSGTVIRVASELGHHGIGFDLDPLAVLMAKVWTTPIDLDCLRASAEGVSIRAAERVTGSVQLAWIDEDAETRRYVDYWFASDQQVELRKLSAELKLIDGIIGDALRIALSRIIITKDRGASLARDVSHSRPHRVRDENNFPVLVEFRRSASRLAQRLEEQPPPAQASIELGDARDLSTNTSSSADAVITSPPYLNAIDYMRGHRLTLVWLGYRVSELRRTRSGSIGAERGPEADADLALANELMVPLGSLTGLPGAEQRMIERHVLDLHRMLAELYRVIKPGGKAILVVGNSHLRGVFIKNARAIVGIAERIGFILKDESERALPPNKRYLPPPRDIVPSDLEKRMRTETVLAFQR